MTVQGAGGAGAAGSNGGAPAGAPPAAGAGASPPAPPANAGEGAPAATPPANAGAPAAAAQGSPPATAGADGAGAPAAPDWREKRIATLSARLKEQNAENERLRALAASAQPPAGQPAAQPQTAPTTSAAPGSVEWNRAVQTEAQRVAAINQWNQDCNNIALTGRAAFGEAQFNGAVASLMKLVDTNDPQSLLAYNGFLTAAMASGNAPQIIMEMAQDLNQAARFMGMSPVQQVAEYTRRVMAAQGAGPNGTGAENTGGAAGASGVQPHPITPIGGRGAAHTVIDPADPARASNLSSADWHARRRIQAEERAKQRQGFR